MFQNALRTCMTTALCTVVCADVSSAAENFLPEESRFTGVEVRIPMRDGKYLAADVYVPKSPRATKSEGAATTVESPMPAILIQTPYDKNSMRGAFRGAGGNHPFYRLECAIVTTDWRGRAGSADALTSISVPGGSEDGFDTIAWIVAQPWCDGKVGTWGGSALARVQYMTAKANHPNHVCGAPSIMPLNLNYDIYFPGGAMWEAYVDVLGRIGFERRSWLVANPINGPFWREQERTVFVKPADVRIPMLVYGGWFDTYTDGVIEAYEAIRAGGGPKAREHTRLLMGPWTHANEGSEQGQLKFENAAGVGGQRSAAFFSHYLRGEGKEETARVTYYQMGANEWRTSDCWPPQSSRDQAYHLQVDKSLSPTAGVDAAAFTFQADPANPVPKVGGRIFQRASGRGPFDQRDKVESRADVLVFSTSVMEQDLAVAGQPRAVVHVSTDGPDADFVAILTDVYPDGRSMAITEGILRLRFREGADHERWAKPGQVYGIEIKLQNTAITFLKGHRARLILTSSSHPYWATNLNDGGPMYDMHVGRIASNTIHVGGQHDSRLMLPVIDN